MADEAGIGFRFLLAVLATWRLTHLITHEDGPAELIYRVRRWLGGGFWGQLMDCFMCFSLWVAAAMALFVASRPAGWTVSWLAVSGGACLLERSTARETATAPPIVIEKLTSTEESDGMLRTESRNPETATPARTAYQHTENRRNAPAQAAAGSQMLRLVNDERIVVHGPRTGWKYEFTPEQPVQAVAASDAEWLIATGRFRRT